MSGNRLAGPSIDFIADPVTMSQEVFTSRNTGGRAREIKSDAEARKGDDTDSSTNLDEVTMNAFRECLSTYVPQAQLRDEEVVKFMIRVNRYATLEAEKQGLLVDELEASENFFIQAIKTILEETNLGREIVHSTVSRVKQRDPELNLDRRTLAWIRKAAGIVRERTESVSARDTRTDQDDHPDHSSANGRRTTRGMARSTRAERREKGIAILSEALNDLSTELLPNIGRPASVYQADGLHCSARNDNETLKAFGKMIGASTLNSGSRKRNRKTSKVPQDRDGDDEKPIIPLRLHDWLKRREGSTPASTNDSGVRRQAYPNDEAMSVPPAYAEAGIVFSSEPTVNSKRLNKTPTLYPLCQRHDTSSYASLCETLMKHLSGNARKWVFHEFFYSDLDRSWYNRNEFARAVARLGIPPGSFLARREWKAIRRSIPIKPRIFSRRFIASQLSERNRYRNTVRMLQANPDPGIAQSLGFDYEVVARIPLGAIVSAFNPKYEVLQRGIVLSYIETQGKYLIKFPHGLHLCCDFEVATHGGPNILLPCPGLPLGYVNRRMNSDFSFGDSYCPGTATCLTGDSLNLYQKLRLRPTSMGGARSSAKDFLSDRNKSAEREALTSLLSTVELLTRRKLMLLDCIESLQKAADDNHELAEDVTNQLPWVRANLDATNDLLDETGRHMRLLYGRAYMPVSQFSGAQESISQHNVVGASTAGVGVNAGETSEPKCMSPSPGRAGHEFLGPRDLVRDSKRPVSYGQRQWLSRLLTDSLLTCERIVDSEMDHDDDEDAEFSTERLSAIARLLLLASGKKPFRASIDTAIDAAAEDVFLADFHPPIPSFYDLKELYFETIAARESATVDLEKALSLLKAEYNAERLDR